MLIVSHPVFPKSVLLTYSFLGDLSSLLHISSSIAFIEKKRRASKRKRTEVDQKFINGIKKGLTHEQ